MNICKFHESSTCVYRSFKHSKSNNMHGIRDPAFAYRQEGILNASRIHRGMLNGMNPEKFNPRDNESTDSISVLTKMIFLEEEDT